MKASAWATSSWAMRNAAARSCISSTAPTAGSRKPMTIRGELEAYGHGLGEKPEILVLNKIDAIEKASVARKRQSLEKASGEDVFTISGVTGAGVDAVLRALAELIVKRRASE